MVNNTEQSGWRWVIKKRIWLSPRGRGLFFCLFLSQHVHPRPIRGSCECWVTLRSFRCTLGSSSHCLCERNTRACQIPPFLSPPSLYFLFFYSSTVSFNFQMKHREGVGAGIISFKERSFKFLPVAFLVDSTSCHCQILTFHLASLSRPRRDLKETFP